MQGWSSQQTCLFLEHLISHSEGGNDIQCAEQPFPSTLLDVLDSAYSFSASRNAEITLRWLSLCLRSHYEKVLPQVVDFITRQGRMKFVRPLYRLLYAVSADTAINTFESHKQLYVIKHICQLFCLMLFVLQLSSHRPQND